MLYLLVTFFLGYEIQKFFQFDYFFRLKSISGLYQKRILKRPKSIVYKEISKIALIDLLYLIILLIGCFTINRYFFCGILLLSVISTLIFKLKNKKIKKTFFVIDIILSIILLLISIINYTFYQIDSLQIIKQILSYDLL